MIDLDDSINISKILMYLVELTKKEKNSEIKEEIYNVIDLLSKADDKITNRVLKDLNDNVKRLE